MTVVSKVIMSPEKDEKQCPGSNQAPSQSTDKKDGTLQRNSGANRIVIWKMDNGRTMIITGSEFTPEDAARIPKRRRGRNTFRGARTDHVPKDCQLNAVLAMTKKEQGATVQPIRQPMVVDNNSLNPSTLSPTTAPVEANLGRSNVARDAHKSLLVPVSAAKVHNQKPAPRDQASRFCRNFVSQDIVSVIVLFQEQQRQFVVIPKLPALPMTPIDT
uniref:Uncharacterized protein n=1 Tax=Oryza rufipogon TaxID=4529 RepID=A0A0E0QFS1_ORYRU